MVSCSGISEKLTAAGIGLDTICQYCATWHSSALCHLSLSALCHLTLALSTVPLDTRCQYCATSLVSTVPLDTRSQYCATWHSLSVLCHLSLAVSTVPLDTSCQYYATWHREADVIRTNLRLPLTRNWHGHIVCVLYIALINVCLYCSNSYSNALYNECCLYNSQTGNVAAAEFRCSSVSWQVWRWSSKWTYPAINIVMWQ